ncbi:MAG TPA: alpha-L-rhamnosidase C-terminal domain-containing protein [Puia sp.]|nr:alpha-L-rhamnosidase C-terminal domain-containing protein [Puia sp.]
MHVKKHGLLIVLVFASLNIYSQPALVNPKWENGFWKAKWIAHPSASGNDFGVFHFRKNISLDEKPSTFVINISADNRYRFFVNGLSVCTGPARSDLANWNFETVDIASYLTPGNNIIAATVWNFAEYRPYSQISYQTAFIIQGNSEKESIINTDKSWKVIQDSGYSPFPIDRTKIQTYIVTAEGEKVDGNKYDWHFEQLNYDDSRWSPASQLWYAAKSRTYGTDGNWMLVPRSIPLAEESAQRFGSVRRSDLENSSPDNYSAFLAGKSSLRIPANKKVKILLDQSHLTNAYPQVIFSKGKNAEIKLVYAEALIDDNRKKGNRDSIEGKKIEGLADEYIADGGDNKMYSPLFFRTFRYLQLEIETKDEPLIINDIRSIFTGYPFTENAVFKSDQQEIDKLWQVGWRTARLCSVDTYFDCPYYEQLQYVGDTRIQAQISLYVSGDDRLMKKAINDIGNSFIPDGLTQSRYPSRDMQLIPTFSLWWVCMVHDFWMHRKDDAFVRSHLDGIAQVLDWYRQHLAGNGMLGSLSWWQFVDWSWDGVDSIRVGGVPPGVSKGGSSIVTLQFAYTLQRASQLMDAYGKKELAEAYEKLARTLIGSTYKLCWDNEKQMLSDTYEKKEFSQHANILGILTDAIPAADQQPLLSRIIADKQITPCTYYFKFYLFEALKKVKMGNAFLPLLEPWFAMLNRGLTTFAEQPDPTRSDCHAWSASPLYELLSLVCGVRPAAPGFEKVLIEPYPGNLKWIDARVPHPKGNILVHLENNQGRIRGTVELPDGVGGTFVWKEKRIELTGGKQSIQL